MNIQVTNKRSRNALAKRMIARQQKLFDKKGHLDDSDVVWKRADNVEDMKKIVEQISKFTNIKKADAFKNPKNNEEYSDLILEGDFNKLTLKTVDELYEITKEVVLGGFGDDDFFSLFLTFVTNNDDSYSFCF